MPLHLHPSQDLAVLQALPDPHLHDLQLRQRPKLLLLAASSQLLLLLKLPLLQMMKQTGLQGVGVVGQSPCLGAVPAVLHAAGLVPLLLLAS
jgi:hypothetical protein